MTDSKIFDKIEMAKYPRYTREIYRYNELIANIQFYPLDNEGHHEIKIQSFLPKNKLSVLITDEFQKESKLEQI